MLICSKNVIDHNVKLLKYSPLQVVVYLVYQVKLLHQMVLIVSDLYVAIAEHTKELVTYASNVQITNWLPLMGRAVQESGARQTRYHNVMEHACPVALTLGFK